MEVTGPTHRQQERAQTSQAFGIETNGNVSTLQEGKGAYEVNPKVFNAKICEF